MFILPSLGNIGSMLFLCFFIFSALGMSLFGALQYRDGEINDLVNFEKFSNSFILLARCSTGETWNYLMHECAKSDYFEKELIKK